MDKIILINKEEGYTSFDVCNKLRRILKTKQIGHTGTLDPNATGLLMVLVNKSCKVLPYIKHAKKTYIATLRLGFKTTTGDIWGDTTATANTSSINLENLNEVLQSFVGASKQIPPMTSAIKVNGKKLYELQREGKTVELKPRDIFIDNIKLLSIEPEIKFEVTCSAGTYIRSLCEDIAEKLGTIGTMSSLIRTKIDEFDIKDAYTLKQIENEEYKYINNYEMLKNYYEMYETDNVDHVKHGKRLRINSMADEIVITNNNEAIAVYEKVEDYLYKSKRGLF